MPILPSHKTILNLPKWILLKCGLSVDTLDEIGTSPLIYAILYNKKKSTEFLIKSGADLELEDFMGNCAKKMLQN